MIFLPGIYFYTLYHSIIKGMKHRSRLIAAAYFEAKIKNLEKEFPAIFLSA